MIEIMILKNTFTFIKPLDTIVRKVSNICFTIAINKHVVG